MRNYVIINGVNSLTIKGLAIKTFPPITKPIQRNLREEIDGRDGDLVTELGYGAYDKTIEIGLFGTFNIDEVIAYFNQKGTITFSNEADKVYYFQALEQVDYAELLKFRTANVVLHCQPFKYPLNEPPLVEEYEYVEATGSNVTLNNTSETIFNKFDLLGNTEQTQYTGKNKFDTTQITTTGIVEKLDTGFKMTCGLNGGGRTAPAWTNPLEAGFYKLTSKLTKSSSSADLRMQVNYTNSTVSYYSVSNNVVNFGNTEKAIASIQFYFQNGTPNDEWAKLENLMIIKSTDSETPYEPYVGGIPAPNPDYPEPIHIVSGDNTIDICGKNLFDGELEAGTIDINGNNVDSTDRVRTKNFAPVKPNESYYLSSDFGDLDSSVGVSVYGRCYDKNKNFISQLTIQKNSTFTIPNDIYYFRWQYIVGNGNQTTAIENHEIMLEKGSTATTYEPYIGNTYHITLPSGIELCKIGTYQDYIYKEDGSWYLHKEIGKVVLNGSEDWQSFAYGTNSWRLSNVLSTNYNENEILLMATKFKGIAQKDRNNSFSQIYFETNTLFTIRNTPYTTLTEVRAGMNGETLYYVLETPTNTQIIDTTLLEQLEAIKNAISYKGQTNISQTNNDAPFILDLSALKENSDHLVIDNIGNIYSKPTLDLEGTGIVDIYLNDTQMFEVDLSEKNEIVIDTEKMEAYNPTDNTLANRQVTGDYSKFKLDSGENDLRFSGDLSKATITNYERWL